MPWRFFNLCAPCNLFLFVAPIVILCRLCSRISVITMTGASMTINNVSAADTVLTVKERVFALNSKLPVRRQQLVYRPGPHGVKPLADKETLGGAGVPQDGSAHIELLPIKLSKTDAAKLGPKVWRYWLCWLCDLLYPSLFVILPFSDSFSLLGLHGALLCFPSVHCGYFGIL